MVRFFLAALLVLGLAPAAAAQELTLSVAISMKEAVEELGRSFMAARPGVVAPVQLRRRRAICRSRSRRARRSTSSSRPPSGRWTSSRAKALIVGATRRAFARNVLTVIKPADSRIDIVEAGRSGSSRGWRGSSSATPRRCRPGSTPRRACERWVSGSGAAQARLLRERPPGARLRRARRGRRRLRLHDRRRHAAAVKEAFRPPEDTYRPVTYPAAVVAASKQAALAQAFLDLLMSQEGQAVLGRLGFQPPPAGVR